MSAHLDIMPTFEAASVGFISAYRTCPRRSGFVWCASAVAAPETSRHVHTTLQTCVNDMVANSMYVADRWHSVVQAQSAMTSC